MADLGHDPQRVPLDDDAHACTLVEKSTSAAVCWVRRDHRRRLGFSGGPQLCVTLLCVMDFHPDTKAAPSLRASRRHIVVQSATGFEVSGSRWPRGTARRDDLPDRPMPNWICATRRPPGSRLREFA